MRPFLLALTFLTRYPLGRNLELKEGDFGRSTAYFPLAGLFVGCDLLALRWIFSLDPHGLHYPLWCFFLLCYWVWSCGSLHLDGLADTCDALSSRARGSDFLKVLHDSRIGAFGAMALALSLLGRYVYLYSLPMRFWWFLPLPLIASRLLGSLLCHARPYAGLENSLSSKFFLEAGHQDQSLALSWAFAAFLALAGISAWAGAADPRGIGLSLVACALGLGLGYAAFSIPRARLGGVSGDLIGYAQEIAELSTAFALLLLLVTS